MRNIFKHSRLLEILFIFILSLTPLLWFRQGSIIVGHDNVFALNPITFLEGRLSSWVDHGFGQSQDLIMGTIPIHLIDAIPYMLGFPLQATEMVVYVFWFFLIGISAYILARQFREQSWAFRLLVVIFYQFNFFLLQGWWIGERTKFSAYIAMPLILTVFLKVYRRELGVIQAAVLNSIIFFVFNAGGLYGIPLYGGLFIALSVFILFFAFLSIVEKNFAAVKRLLLVAILSVFGYLLVNSYFIFPAISRVNDEYQTGVSNAGGVEGLLDWVNIISANTSYMNLFRLQGIAEWYDNPEHPYAKYYLQNPALTLASFLFPLLIFLSLFTVRERKLRIFVLFFFVVYLLGIFFSAGSHLPFGFAYNFLLKTIPGFAIFRSPFYKFAPAIFLAASFLIAFSVDRLEGKTKRVIFFVMFLFILVYHFPYFVVDIFSWREGFSTRLQVPEYVFQFGKWLTNEKKDDARILFLPPNSSNLRYSAYDWGYLSFQSLPSLFSNKAIIVNNDRVNDSERRLVEAFYTAFTNSDDQSIYRLAAYAGVGYFLLQEDTVSEDVRSSFSFSAKPYREFIENKLHLTLVKKFGRWYLYKIDSNVFAIMPSFYIKDRMSIVSGKIKDFSTYYDFTNNVQTFVRKEDLQTVMLGIDSLTDIYSPNCLKCKKKDRPFIKYPDRNILPDSPFYQMVLYSEEQNLHWNDPKSLIYDYLGLTLKRFSEMREMIEKDIPVKDPVLNRYEAMIRQIHANFNKLPKNEAKFDVAEDLRYYIDDQRSVITEMLGDRVRAGLPVLLFTRVLASLETLEKALQEYIFRPDITHNRLYNLTIDRLGTFNLNIRSREFANLMKSKGKIRVQIDGGQYRELTLDPSSFRSEWLSFGDVTLQKGAHTILLSFTELINLFGQLSPSITEFSGNGKVECYTTSIRDFDRRKRYKTIIRYRNEFFSDLNVYIWEEKEKGRRVRSADRLRPSLGEDEFTQDIEPQGDVKGITLGICASDLTQEYLRDRFDVRVHEFVEPIVLFVSRDWQSSPTREVAYQKVSPTKYTVSFTSFSPNTMFVFLSRFDNGWELESFAKKHILVNGFANGWVIEKPGRYSLELEYKPQKVFQLGSLVSLVSVSGAIVYSIIALKRPKREKYNDK